MANIIGTIISAFITAFMFPMVAGWFGYTIAIAYWPLVGIFLISSFISAAAILAIIFVLAFIADL